jgi:hypothetical protein
MPMIGRAAGPAFMKNLGVHDQVRSSAMRAG